MADSGGPSKSGTADLNFDGGGWYQVHNLVADVYLPLIGDAAFALYCVLRRWSFGAGVVSKTYDELAARASRSPKAVMRSVEKLEAWGLIERQVHRGRGGVGDDGTPWARDGKNVYRLLQPVAEPVRDEARITRSGRGNFRRATAPATGGIVTPASQSIRRTGATPTGGIVPPTSQSLSHQRHNEYPTNGTMDCDVDGIVVNTATENCVNTSSQDGTAPSLRSVAPSAGSGRDPDSGAGPASADGESGPGTAPIGEAVSTGETSVRDVGGRASTGRVVKNITISHLSKNADVSDAKDQPGPAGPVAPAGRLDPAALVGIACWAAGVDRRAFAPDRAAFRRELGTAKYFVDLYGITVRDVPYVEDLMARNYQDAAAEGWLDDDRPVSIAQLLSGWQLPDERDPDEPGAMAPPTPAQAPAEPMGVVPPPPAPVPAPAAQAGVDLVPPPPPAPLGRLCTQCGERPALRDTKFCPACWEQLRMRSAS